MRRTRSVALYIVIALGQPAVLPAQSKTLLISGTAGYLSEWELSGDAVQQGTADGAFSGQLLWKHVGLCSATGPQEKSGAVTLRIFRARGSSWIEASMMFGDRQCNYRSELGSYLTGHMDCPAAEGIPISISIK